MLSLLPPGGGQIFSAACLGSCVGVLLLGTSAGLYQIPIQAFLEYRSPARSRGSILAATNFLVFTGMLISAGLFWLVTGPLGLRPNRIFLALGMATVPVLAYVVWVLPGHWVGGRQRVEYAVGRQRTFVARQRLGGYYGTRRWPRIVCVGATCAWEISRVPPCTGWLVYWGWSSCCCWRGRFRKTGGG